MYLKILLILVYVVLGLLVVVGMYFMFKSNAAQSEKGTLQTSITIIPDKPQ